jgi:hypothetical protein
MLDFLVDVPQCWVERGRHGTFCTDSGLCILYSDYIQSILEKPKRLE